MSISMYSASVYENSEVSFEDLQARYNYKGIYAAI